MKDANWAEWANEQAVLLKSAGLDLEDEIKVAEIVLECGGNPAELAILMHGDRGLSQSQLLKNLRELKQIRVHFGNLDHEDYDPVGYDAFNENLVIEKDLFVIPSYDGRIRSIRRRRYWDEYDFKKSKDQVARLFQLILRRAWKAYREEEHHEVVGSVDGAEIERYVTWYSREY